MTIAEFVSRNKGVVLRYWYKDAPEGTMADFTTILDYLELPNGTVYLIGEDFAGYTSFIELSTITFAISDDDQDGDLP